MTKFSEFIKNYRNGLIDELLGEKLLEVTSAVENISRKGILSISIELIPAGKGKMDVAIIYNAKPPIHNKVSGVMFVDKLNQLVVDDPSQQTLDLKLHSPEPEILKSIAI